MEREIKMILYQWASGVIKINYNRKISLMKKSLEQDKLYKELLEKLEIKLK